ncbi:hypothetical protein NQD34_003469 [Periophthalmus magnuspinnatus]|nr:hypothetical protein NQD34_003469 [Periophthalmus magnuspinnatus]
MLSGAALVAIGCNALLLVLMLLLCVVMYRACRVPNCPEGVPPVWTGWPITEELQRNWPITEELQRNWPITEELKTNLPITEEHQTNCPECQTITEQLQPITKERHTNQPITEKQRTD